MSSDTTVTLDKRALDRLIGTMRPAAGRVVAKTARDVEGRAKTSAPVDTGNLVASIHSRKAEEFAWDVVVGAEYGAHVEFGTRRATAQPFLFPAVDAVAEPFTAAIAAIFERGAA